MADTPTKSPDIKGGAIAGSPGGNLAELLTNSTFGARVSGLLLVVGEIQCFEGKNDNGSSYKTYRRRLEVFAGPKNGTVVCAEAHKTDAEFQPLALAQIVNWPILHAKTDGKQLVFRVDPYQGG